jgi:glycosyltransferase involved in cell wall biosynthesis
MMKGVSVILCTYNGVKRLQSTIESILIQKSSCSWELIIVDNASTDGTGKLCTDILSQSSINWKIIVEINQGLSHARIRGLQSAQYDYVLFCDDDNHLCQNYVQIGFDLFEKHLDIGVIGGTGIALFEKEEPHWFKNYSHSFAIGPQANSSGCLKKKPAYVYGAGCFYRKQPILDFYSNGFCSIMSDRKGNSLASGGDVEWCFLMQLAGYDIWYEQSMRFMHFMPESRMNWPYYLRLKQNIASGTASLLPYSVLIKNRDASYFVFLRHWTTEAIKSKLMYYTRRVRIAIKNKILSDVDELGILILQAKMKSFRNSFFTVNRQFKLLKHLICLPFSR